MSDDAQFCLREGQPHEPHCVEEQGHWHCPGKAGAAPMGDEFDHMRFVAELMPDMLPGKMFARMVAAEEALAVVRQQLAGAPHDTVSCATWYGPQDAGCTCWKARL